MIPGAAALTGFRYVDAVVDAIEDFTAKTTAEDSEAFAYRGANLRFAVERALYVRLTNDPEAFDRFRVGAAGVDESFRATLRRRTAVEYRRLIGRLRSPSAGVERSPSCAEPPEVLVHVIHEKFVRFLRPILECLPVSYAYVAALNEEFARVLTRCGVPYVDATRLGDSSARAGGALAAFGELPSWYDRIHATLSVMKPRCVVLVEGNAAQDEVVNRACGALGIPTVCIQHGWSPFVHNGFRNMTYTRMAVWGEGFEQLLQPYNAAQQFVITGHPELSRGVRDAARDARRRAIGFFLQAPGPLITNDAWQDFLGLIINTSRELPDWEILVREHPARALLESERRSIVSLRNVKLASHETETLSAVLERVAVAVSIYSTVLLESVAAGAIPVIVNLTSMPSYSPDIAASGAGVEVRDATEALDVITRLARSERHRDDFARPLCEFRRRFFEPASSPDNRIASLIAEQTGH